MENFIAGSLGNVSLTVLNGEVEFIQNARDSESKVVRKMSLTAGESTKVSRKAFHHIKTTSNQPSCYMYSFINETAQRNK